MSVRTGRHRLGRGLSSACAEMAGIETAATGSAEGLSSACAEMAGIETDRAPRGSVSLWSVVA